MPIETRKFTQNLLKKGFIEKEGHHRYFFHIHDGKETGIKTKVSHTRKMKDISNDLISQIKKQLKLNNNSQVKDLANCPMSEKDYIDFLQMNEKL